MKIFVVDHIASGFGVYAGCVANEFRTAEMSVASFS